jgi:hypothetical protein
MRKEIQGDKGVAWWGCDSRVPGLDESGRLWVGSRDQRSVAQEVQAHVSVGNKGP